MPPLSQPIYGGLTPAPGQAVQNQPPLGQPVLGAPQPAGQQQTAAVGGAAFGPTPNPYNLPDDMVGGQPQNQQFGGLLQQFEAARQQSNLANEARYRQGLQGYQDYERGFSERASNLMGELQGFGEAQRQRLGDQFTQEKAGLTQDMINRGLYNATTLDQARQGLSRQQQRQQLQLDDMLRRQRMDYGARLSGEALQAQLPGLQFLENRTDVGPSYQDVAGVSGLVGASQTAVPGYLSALGAGGGAGGGVPAPPSGSVPGAGGGIPTTLPGPGAPAPGLPQIPDPVRSPTQPNVDLNYTPPARQGTQINVARGTRTGATGGGFSGGGGGGGGGGGSTFSPRSQTGDAFARQQSRGSAQFGGAARTTGGSGTTAARTTGGARSSGLQYSGPGARGPVSSSTPALGYAEGLAAAYPGAFQQQVTSEPQPQQQAASEESSFLAGAESLGRGGEEAKSAWAKYVAPSLRGGKTLNDIKWDNVWQNLTPDWLVDLVWSVDSKRGSGGYSPHTDSPTQ